jgi:hypothetical protein
MVDVLPFLWRHFHNDALCLRWVLLVRRFARAGDRSFWLNVVTLRGKSSITERN